MSKSKNNFHIYLKNSNKRLPFSERGGRLLEAIGFGDGKKRSKQFCFWSISYRKKGITSDAIAMPVTHIFSSPLENLPL